MLMKIWYNLNKTEKVINFKNKEGYSNYFFSGKITRKDIQKRKSLEKNIKPLLDKRVIWWKR